MREADHYDRAAARFAHCRLCPHRCEIAPGDAGICGARRSIDGILYAANYEEIGRLAPGPVEGLPLFHFAPGTSALFVGSTGDSFPPELAPPGRAAAAEDETRFAALHEVIDIAAHHALPAIACAGGEPFMWLEQMRELAERARAEGLANLLATNGYAVEAPVREVAPLIDAANVSLLGPAAVYERRARARREPVLETIEILRAAGVHLEATYVVLAGENDDDAALDELAALVGERLDGAPLHVASPLDPETAAPVRVMERVADRLRARLPHVYLSSVYARESSDTACRQCGAQLVERRGTRVATPGLAADGACRKCGAPNHFRLPPQRPSPKVR